MKRNTYIYFEAIVTMFPVRRSAHRVSLVANPTANRHRQYDAVIVGAGWAGIRAAEVLASEGITSLLVLEAQDVVGGRARSLNGDGSFNDPSMVGDDGNVPYDEGEEWLMAGTDMEDAMGGRGYLDAVAGNDMDTAMSLEDVTFYRRTEDGETNVYDDGAGWVGDVWWGGFLAYREDNDLGEASYEGEFDPDGVGRSPGTSEDDARATQDGGWRRGGVVDRRRTRRERLRNSTSRREGPVGHAPPTSDHSCWSPS
ncbi:hypothetical protein ACHAWF_003597 [Thalassiosira exigua]